jgi:predicted KAP-like P-loop ATPase
MKSKDRNPNPSQWLSADRPIETRAEDDLGRLGFSEALANAIYGWSGQDSLVLALYGAWGNGKSSIKNMAVESLSQHSPAVRCVDFNPWQLANRPNLSEAFFDELGVALGKDNLGTSSQKKSTLNKLRRWALRLHGAHDLAKATRNVIVMLLILFGLTLGSAWAFPRYLSITLGFIALLLAFLALTTGIVEAFIKIFAAGTEVGRKSLSEVKNELADDLKKLKTPILVILDDLDRLTPQEILEVFQLIKANGDFPNVIYLILCDRTIVEGSITKALNVPGRDYLEKIVQVAFDVPMIDIARVRHVLFSRLDSLLSAKGVSAHFSAKRWTNVFLSSLHTYFTTLRDVNRYISTLAFQISSFSVDGVFEVNPIDLIGLEAIRLFDPEVYNALQSSKEIFTSEEPDGHSANTTKQALNSIVELAAEDRRDQLKGLLKHLFPTIEWAFGGPHYAREYGQQWYRDLRVCSPKMFDRYFRLSVSDAELSQSVVQKLLSARGDRKQLRTLLESQNPQGLLNTALEELAVYQDELEPEQVEPFITAIFDIGDLLSETKKGGFEIPIQWSVSFLVQHSLEKLIDVESRSKVLTNTVENTTGVSMAIEVLSLLIAKSEDVTKEPLLPEAKAAEIIKVGLRKIEDAAASGALVESRRLGWLLHIWLEWGKKEDVMSYVDRITSSPDGTLKFLKSLELCAHAQHIGDYAVTERYYFQRNDIEPLISMERLNERVQVLAAENLDEAGHRVIMNFQKAMERRSAGKPDSGPFIED